MTWATYRENIFTDPRATRPSDPNAWGCGGTHTLSSITDADGTRWVRSTRVGSGAGRIIEFKAQRISPGIPQRLKIIMRASHATTGQIQLRGAVGDSSSGVVVADLVIPVGVSTQEGTGTHNGGNVLPGFVIITSTDPVGSTMDFRAVLVEENPIAGAPYFDGSAPNPSDTERYLWEDREDKSVSLDQLYTYIDPAPNGGPKYAPVVKLLGATLECEFAPDGQNPVVLDGIEIEWGRDALYDPTNPSEVRFDLLDPTGQFASDPALFGAPLTIETPLGVLFRGRIDAVSIEPDVISDANPNVPNDVWLVKISATDVIASLAKLVVPGKEHGDGNEEYEGYVRQKYGPGYWNEYNSESRRLQIYQQWVAHGINTTLNTKDFATMVPPGSPITWQDYFWEPTLKAGADLYTLAQSVIARGDRPFYVNYLPGEDKLNAGSWPPPVPLTLFYADGRIQIEPLVTDSDETIVIDCALVEVAEPGAVESTVTHNIASLRIEESFYVIERVDAIPPATGYANINVWESTDVELEVVAPGGGTAQYQPPVNVGVKKGASGMSQSGKQFGELLKPYIESVNGRMVPPDFIFDLEAYDYTEHVNEELLTTWGSKAPWVFPGSRYDVLTGYGPAFQHIGGALTYKQGWRVRGRFAPSPVDATSTLTLDELATDSDRLLSEFASNVMLIHLAGISETNV